MFFLHFHLRMLKYSYIFACRKFRNSTELNYKKIRIMKTKLTDAIQKGLENMIGTDDIIRAFVEENEVCVAMYMSDYYYRYDDDCKNAYNVVFYISPNDCGVYNIDLDEYIDGEEEYFGDILKHDFNIHKSENDMFNFISEKYKVV